MLFYEGYMSNKPLVSVIIIFLNAERFIEEAIESVIGQTYSNWEILLVDDGSTDSSSEIARYYAALYNSRVRYLEHDRHENRGMSASRNLGINNSKGEYIAFLDSDDVWLPNKLERQITILEDYPEVALVYGTTKIWRSWSDNSSDKQYDKPQKLIVKVDSVTRPPKLLEIFLCKEYATPTEILVRSQIVKSLGGFEDSFRGMYEDQVFLAKVCLQYSVFASSECWLKYRIHPDSCCNVEVKAGRHDEARIVFLNWLSKYLSKQSPKNCYLLWVVKKELWGYRYPSLKRLLGRAHRTMRRVRKYL
jgi:glycosyltransferase involved in cell wall biosynthesis